LGGQLLLHHLGHDPQTHRHAHGQQPFAGGASHLTERQAQLVGELRQLGCLIPVDETNDG
jgi:hypothetical protein